jgi:hypothetical protein
MIRGTTGALEAYEPINWFAPQFVHQRLISPSIPQK